MIIEFVGPSGSGKTVLAQQWAVRHDALNVQVAKTKDKIIFLVWFIARHPISFVYLFFRTVWEGRHSLRLARHKLFLLGMYIVRTVAAHTRGKSRIVILDEGLGQYALSLFERAVSRDTLMRYRALTPTSDIVIYVHATMDTRMQHMETRGRFPRATIITDQRTWQTILQKNADMLREILHDVPHPVLVIDTTNTAPDNSYRLLEEWLQTYNV